MQIEITKDGVCFLNQRRLNLLRSIAQTGSINRASKELKMSYQQAWSYIKEINEMSRLPVVVRKRGGANGGGAEVTRYGFKLIKGYEAFITESLHKSGAYQSPEPSFLSCDILSDR